MFQIFELFIFNHSSLLSLILTVYNYFGFGFIGIAHARVLASIRNLGVLDDELPLPAILFDLYPAR